MPTRDRPGFFEQAMRCFQRQTYDQAELIVLDDGQEPVENLCSGLPRVRYVRLDQPTLTGTKMNIGVEHARGNILQKMDDDYYYHPDFLQLAVDHLRSERRGDSVVVWCCYLIFLAGEKHLRHSGHGWKTGGTLCFPREMWQRRPFRDIRTGYDSWFLRDHDPNIVRVCAAEHYIVVRHGGNTWTKMSDGDEADNFLRGRPIHSKPIEAIVDPRDHAFYHSLCQARAPDAAARLAARGEA